MNASFHPSRSKEIPATHRRPPPLSIHPLLGFIQPSFFFLQHSTIWAHVQPNLPAMYQNVSMLSTPSYEVFAVSVGQGYLLPHLVVRKSPSNYTKNSRLKKNL